MEDRDIILMEIPHQLDKLKRPALQQMCKRFGLKANGKNVDMVKALTGLRQSKASCNTSQSSVDVGGASSPCSSPASSPLQTSLSQNSSSTTRKRSLPEDDVQEHEPPTKRGRRQNKRKGRARRKRSTCTKDEEELLCTSQNSLQIESSLPSTPQTDDYPPTLQESASEQRRKRKRWSDEAIMTPPVLLDEIPAPKRTRRATYSVSPPSHFSQPVQQESEVETESEIMEEVFPISPPSPSSPAIQQVSELETEREVTRKAPPLSPPVPTADLESSTRQRHSTYTILERDSESTSSPKVTSGAVSDLMEVCSEEEDTHAQIMTLLEQRVEERKLDPNYKPVFTASNSKIPVKKGTCTSKKFHQAHQRHFNQMTSIVDHQRNKEKRAKELRKRSTFKTPDRRFEPSVLKPQHANFNFGRKSTFKTPASTASKLPILSKTAETVRHREKSFDVKASLKKETKYVPRKGKLPEFKLNLY